MSDTRTSCIAFRNDRRIAEGVLRDIARDIKQAIGTDSPEGVLVFNVETSQPVEIDLRGSLDDVLARLPAAPQPAEPAPAEPARGPGRPKLGVVAREITLLPRHWDWLALQPGGASVALRRLIDEARKTHGSKDRMRQAQEAAYRFASVMAGNRTHYEDAMRALFAGNRTRFIELTDGWPTDIRDHARRLAAPALHDDSSGTTR
ncbi:DUF2239 family protein [Bradyrhizobium sp. U87765 SZCCT0131]|uniref:DUF2239 family protein n=1 Tax=unclassified Bradyrhizobium TaxID=2631580 RepID=UPI001BA804D5|nr:MULTISPECIES: DUF2239 family protein [unclassified Bradyrhizobium]MBR1216893.1 DUF2239 family protein [Bradyrhizobium sp. U87765 SZCCT0131]MBR1259351.1 DUF2239 family protein [Bradyrhizobium sp. U87765 SZCCT0134]MBR1305492.1 DUF2239 family protein [Bradyrhizobium sp. U87765 SZCCT0110]MBR1321859.1 DUF2239 family protein [Bradyrhizobium sp. U87765 SZCCT0109]MBR1350863.1 DUF2239 family protein [Bradyrhizobium sp. U87765 SZCCT0048]